GAVGRRRNSAHALAQHRPWIHIDERCGLAHLLRRVGSASRRSAHWTHRRPRRHKVRRLAAIERRVRKAVRRRDPRLAAQRPEALKRGRRMNLMESTLQKPAFVAANITPKAKTIVYWIVTALF